MREPLLELIETAMAAFRSDPSYVIEMCEHAALLDSGRRIWRRPRRDQFTVR